MAEPGIIDVEARAYGNAGKVELTLDLYIPEGTHLEAHEPPDPFLIPTEVDFDGLEVIAVSYPEPTEKDLGLGGPALQVYEGTVSITARGRTDETVEFASGTVRYQPCVGGACLPPREQEWRTPILTR